MKDNVMGYETLSWIIDSSQKGFFAVTASPAMQRVILSRYNHSSILVFDYSKKKHPFDYSKLSKELSKKKNKDIRTCFIFNFQLAVDTEDDLIRWNHSRDMLAGENKNLVFFMDENTYRKINLKARDFFSYFQLKLEFEDEGVLPIGKEYFDFNYTGAQGTDTAEPIAIDFNKPKEELLARAIALSNRATALVNNGEYAKAKAALEAVVKIRERLLGEEHPDTAASYNNIANMYYVKGEYDHALEYHEKALAIREKVLGKEHPDTATSYNNIALVYNTKGEYDRALEYYEKALAIVENVLGKEHPHTAASYNNIGVLFYKMGRLDDAAANLARALGTFLSFCLDRESGIALSWLSDVYSAKGGDPSDEAAFKKWVKKLISSLD